MYVALDNIFFCQAKQIYWNTYLKQFLGPGVVPIRLHPSELSALLQHCNLYLNQADADTRDSVTTSVTLHCLYHSVSRGDSEKLQQTAGRLPAQENPTTNTLTYHSYWSDHRCAHGKYAHTHTYAKTFLPSPVCCVSNTHTHRQELAYCTPAPSNPPPRSKQPPSGLVRANPAVDSAAPIAAPPPLRVVREMKALGVHYKTTTAAAGDRPPGATNYPFSSLHPHLFPSCPSISQPRSTLLLSATHLSHREERGFLKIQHSRWIKLNIDPQYYNMRS